MAPGIDLAR
jgi:hypothetical protein